MIAMSVSGMSAQLGGTNPGVPRPGTAAPALGFNHLLQAPAGAKADWPSLHGKVVVLEFWATWCVPCVAEIPVLNALQASLDPAKVQFISVDDEDPARVENFLKKKPIAGWIGLDTSGKVFERYGVLGRPETMIIGPDGRVVATSVRPENLAPEQLLALAKGKPAHLGDTANTVAASSAAMAERNAALAQAFPAPHSYAAKDPAAPLDITVTPGDQEDGHILPRGQGVLDITNSPVKLLVVFGLGVPSSRIVTKGEVTQKNYNLHVDAPDADPKQLAKAIEAAITAGTGVAITHHAETEDAYVLTAEPGAQEHLKPWPYPGGAIFNPQTQTLQCINATLDDIANGLEKAIGAPVVNETGLKGAVMINLQVAPKDVASANDALEKSLSLKLVPAKRVIDKVVLSEDAKP